MTTPLTTRPLTTRPLTTRPLTTRRLTTGAALITGAALALTTLSLAGTAQAGTVPSGWLDQYTPPAGALPSQNGSLISPVADLTRPVTVGPLDGNGNYLNLPYAKDFHLVMYRTTNARGQAIPVTAMVIRSKANLHTYPAGSVRPLVAYAPGNQGMDDACGSSAAMRNGAWYENSPVNGILSKGFDVVVPDYEGLGINDGRLHPVANNRSNGQATLDSLRAAQLAMPSFKAYVNGTGTYVPAPSPVPVQMGVWGYSEGGGAAAWAASHLSYAHTAVRSKINAVAAGGVTADLQVIGQVADGQDQPAHSPTDINTGQPLASRGSFTVPQQKVDGDTTTAAPNAYSALILMALASFEATYAPSVSTDPANNYDHSRFVLSNLLTNDTSATSLFKGTGWIAQVKEKCLVDGLAVAAGLHAANYVRNTDGTVTSPAVSPFPAPVTATAANPLRNATWVQKFRQNNPAYLDGVGVARPSVPVFLYHGTNDTSVAYPQTVELRERWCAAGADVHWRRYLSKEHVQTWGVWASPLGWLQQQFYAKAGLPNSAGTYGNNCATDPNLT